MTIDKSLKVRAALIRTRSVLTRAERIEKLQSSDRWTDGDSPVGLSKVRVYKLQMKKKKKEAADDAAAAAPAAGAAKKK